MVILSYIERVLTSFVRFVFSYRMLRRLEKQARFFSVSAVGDVDNKPLVLTDEQSELISIEHDPATHCIKAVLSVKASVDLNFRDEIDEENKVLHYTPKKARVRINNTFNVTFTTADADVVAYTWVSVPGDPDGRRVDSKFSCDLKVTDLEVNVKAFCRDLYLGQIHRLCSGEPWHRFRIAILLGLLHAHEQATLSESDLKAYEKLRTHVTEG